MPALGLPYTGRWPWRHLTILLTISALYMLYFGFYPFTITHPDALPISSLKTAGAVCHDLPKNKRVAIIGAGSAGTSTAYYLARIQAAGQIDPCINLTITIFERNSYIGGRSTTVQAYTSTAHRSDSGYPLVDNAGPTNHEKQQLLELGGSIFVKVNTNLVNAAEALGLKLQSASHGQPRLSAFGLGVWDGSEFRFLSREDDSWWLELGKLFYKYGLAPLWAQRAMKSTVGNFQKMYDEPFFPWKSLTDIVKEVGLDGVTSISGRDFLDQHGVGTSFSDEIIQASTRVNYAQNLEQIHGLETMVCMATDGALRVEGGNWRIFAGMAKSSGAELRLNTSVRAIYSLPKEKTAARFKVTSTSSSPKLGGSTIEADEEFDEVVLATPLQFSGIDISNLSPEYILPRLISYVKLHVTLFATRHRLSPSFFGLASGDEVPKTILTTQPSDHNLRGPDFFSISTLRNLTHPQSGDREYAYKIFSSSAINAIFLGSLFGLDDHSNFSKEISWIYPHTWHAYPYLPPKIVFDGPQLGDGLWYTSGIESFISTMETSSLAGRNVAALLTRKWNGKTTTPDSQSKAGL